MGQIVVVALFLLWQFYICPTHPETMGITTTTFRCKSRANNKKGLKMSFSVTKPICGCFLWPPPTINRRTHEGNPFFRLIPELYRKICHLSPPSIRTLANQKTKSHPRGLLFNRKRDSKCQWIPLKRNMVSRLRGWLAKARSVDVCLFS